jgi:hypothetical protein
MSKPLPEEREMIRAIRDERGIALISVMIVVILFGIFVVIGLSLAGKDTGISTVRAHGARSMAIAEGGAWRGRSALMAIMGADPLGAATVPDIVASDLTPMYASQNPFSILDHISLDGARYSVGASSSTDWVLFHVNWSASEPRRKLTFVQVGSGAAPANPLAVGAAPANDLGTGSFRAAVVLERRREPASSAADCPPSAPPEGCYVQQLAGAGEYEFFYKFTVVSEGLVNPRYRRRVTLQGDFSTLIANSTFAKYALFTDVHMTPGGSRIYFSNRVRFDGPVHTNDELAFATFPKFGTPDAGSPCSSARIGSTPLTSTGTSAWFNNAGSPVRAPRNENVVGGVRRDAPVLPDCTVGDLADDNDNAAANFTRGFDGDPATPGIQPIVVALSSWNQKAVSVGFAGATSEDPGTVPNFRVRMVVPELADNSSPVPAGIYVPVTDNNTNDVSDAGEPLAGGIYVQGNLTSLTFGQTTPAASPGVCTNATGCGVYTLVQGGQTVTVVVDRLAARTTVTNTSWPAGNQTRTFTGVPKGLQISPPARTNAAMIFVQGDIQSLSGTLEESEQAMVSATGRIDITDHVRYERVPVTTDPSSNPVNILGIYSRNNDVRITTHASGTAGTHDLDIHAIVMAGTPGVSDGYNSQFYVLNAASGPLRGAVRLIGGAISEYYGQFGTFNMTTGAGTTGYERNFAYDRRMERGYAPPYFPTRVGFVIRPGRMPIAGARPLWRETTP